MGSAGAEAGDGVRQAGGLPGRDSREVNSSSCYLHAGARHLSLQLWGREEVSWIIRQKHRNRRGCLWVLAVWGEGCFSSYSLSNRPILQASM